VARARRTTPAGHGELLAEPPFDQWATMAREAVRDAEGWDFAVGGVSGSDLRALARTEAIERARAFSSRLGVTVREVPDAPDLIVATGHQPELYHPGVWVKDFLLERLAVEIGAAAVDLVVDSDGFDSVGIHSPCLRPEVRVCRAYLAVGERDGCFACASVPLQAELREFRLAGQEQLATLPAPAIGHHFARFCDELDSSAPDARNLAELVTMARRRYEASAGTGYLELPVTSLARSRAFAVFASDMAIDAERFASVYNGALASHRERTGVRNAAQPFPDLGAEGGRIELPLWVLDRGRRTVWVRTGAEPALFAGDALLCELGADPCGAADHLLASGVALAPKALALTLFTRMFVSDLFIHGVGGGRYDQVTDEVARRYFGVAAPPYVVASLTMYLPLGAQVVGEDELAEVSTALNRLAQNPDQMLGEVEFDSAEEAARAESLVSEKRELVDAIARAGADKKAVGARIREVNAALAALLAPIRDKLTERRERLTLLRDARDILTDRTYPFCFWDPGEIADKVR
jgi:hypothetical protein